MTSQFDPEGWYKLLHDAVVAETIHNRMVSTSELIQLDGPNMRWYAHARQERGSDSQGKGSGGRAKCYWDPPPLTDHHIPDLVPHALPKASCKQMPAISSAVSAWIVSCLSAIRA